MEDINVDKELKELSSAHITKKDIYIDMLKYKNELDTQTNKIKELIDKTEKSAKNMDTLFNTKPLGMDKNIYWYFLEDLKSLLPKEVK